MPASTHDPSAMCLDLNWFLLEADSKDPVVPVCHHHTAPELPNAVLELSPLPEIVPDQEEEKRPSEQREESIITHF
jgi:hypothetical protein